MRGACARGIIHRRLLPDVCSCCISECVSKCGSKRACHCLPRPAHQLFSFKRFGLSDTEEVKYRNARLSHYLVYMQLRGRVNIK